MYSFYPNTSAYWIPPPTAFDPVDLDMDSWIQAAVAFNAKYAVLTTKHDSGFCLW
jgi:alpha-L-fucosidase